MTLPFQQPQSSQRGNGPPTDVTPAQLVRRILDTARAHEIVPWMRKDDDGKPLGEFWLQVLTQSELDDAAIDAEKYVRSRMAERSRALGETPEEAKSSVNQEAWREIFESARMVEVIWRACRDKDDARRPLFQAPSDIRQHLSSPEITHLINEYDSVQRKYGPLFRLLSKDEIDEWIAILMKGMDGSDPFGLLCSLAPGEKDQLILSLASRLRSSSQTGNGSDGSQFGSGIASESNPSQVSPEFASGATFTTESE
jgi:hypothetical protein